VHVGVEIGPHSLVAMRIGQRPRWAVCAGWGRRPGNGGLDQQRQELAVDSVAAGKGGGGALTGGGGSDGRRGGDGGFGAGEGLGGVLQGGAATGGGDGVSGLRRPM
jgi:hypothetical protein